MTDFDHDAILAEQGQRAEPAVWAGYKDTKPMRRRRAPEKRAMWRWKRELEKLGCDVTLFSQPFRARQTKGIPDMYVRHPRWRIQLWVEAKAGRNKPTPGQEAWGAAEIEAGGAWIVAHDLGAILDEMRRLGAPLG